MPLRSAAESSFCIELNMHKTYTSGVFQVFTGHHTSRLLCTTEIFSCHATTETQNVADYTAELDMML